MWLTPETCRVNLWNNKYTAVCFTWLENYILYTGFFFYFIPIYITDSWSCQIGSQRFRNSALYASPVLTFTASAFLRDCIYKNVFRVFLAVNSDYVYIPERHYPIGRCEVVAVSRMSSCRAVHPQRVLQFPASCGTGKFMAEFARALLCSVFRTRRIQAMSCRRI